MRPLSRLIAIVLGLFLSLPACAVESLVLTAADGVRVHGELWRAAGAHTPVILAFHQAGSSGAEYAPIAPRLVQAGYTVLAIDQRSGDGEFGGTNRTAAGLGREASYEEALPDLEAALAWAKADAHGAPVVAWGSSYSAALVFLLAARHPGELAGVVAFSPGEYLSDRSAVRAAARQVHVPVYVDQASAREEIEQSAAIVAALPGKEKHQERSAAPSTHGSSTLRADSNPGGAEAHWTAVLAFLKRYR